MVVRAGVGLHRMGDLSALLVVGKLLARLTIDHAICAPIPRQSDQLGKSGVFGSMAFGYLATYIPQEEACL